MTASAGSRAPAHQGGRSALSRLAAVPVDTFTDTHWGRAPLLSRAVDLPQPFADLFGHAAVDELISQRALRAPFLRVAKNGATLGNDAFTEAGGVGAAITDQVSDDKLLRLFADGATLVLQGLHRSWGPLLHFCQELAAELGHPVQANAYVTPPQNTGFSDHYDVHDVFVIQVEGQKRWRIHAPVHEAPLRHEPWTDRRPAVEAAALTDPLIEVTLDPGDSLYLPRGFLHAATALGEVSTHVTLGIHTWTRRHVAEDLLAAALRRVSEDVSVRQSLPARLDPDDTETWAPDIALVRSALSQALDAVSDAELRTMLAKRSRRTQRAAPIGLLAQVAAAGALGGHHTVLLRPHLAATLSATGGGQVTLESRAGTLTFDTAYAPALTRLLDSGRSDVAALGEDLARSLVLGGIVLVE